MSSPFPSSQERTVASALLLLFTTPPSLSPPRFDSDPNDVLLDESINKSCRESFVSSVSKPSSSSLTNDDGSFENIRARRIRFFSAVTRYREMKFKIVKKSRSKIMWASGNPKQNPCMASRVSTGSASTEASSCLSSSSSGISSARRLRDIDRARGENKLGIVARQAQKPKYIVGSAHLRRRAEAILKFLSGGGSSEVRIRQMLGDSPDTSKALRMLLRLNEVKRSGTGGRHDPFIYTICG